MQTTFILNAMAEEAEKEGTKLDQILESIDLLFTRVTDIGLTQQRMRTQLELNTQAVAQLRLSCVSTSELVLHLRRPTAIPFLQRR